MSVMNLEAGNLIQSLDDLDEEKERDIRDCSLGFPAHLASLPPHHKH